MVTNYIKNASYKEIYDLHTDSFSTSILTFHSPVTNIPRQILGGFFDQYRRFKYKGMTVKLRPAARLPADPLQVSYESGEPTLDPRDMLNPILVRGYCGDSLGWFLNYWNTPGAQSWVRQTALGSNRERFTSAGFFGDSVDRSAFPDKAPGTANGDLRTNYLQTLYYQSLSDPGWHKIPMQKGYRRSFRPLVYELATTAQRLATRTVDNVIAVQASDPAGATVINAQETGLIGTPGTSFDTGANPGGSSGPQGSIVDGYIDKFATGYTGQIASATNQIRLYRTTSPVLTSHKRPLGWLDTDTVIDHRMPQYVSDSERVVKTVGSGYSDYLLPTDGPNAAFNNKTDPDTPTLPLINMAVAILPKAYKQEMYYRLEITHHFDFKDYRPLVGLVSPFDDSSIAGSRLEWADWDDAAIVNPGPSVTSTSKNFELVDVTPVGTGDTESA